MNAKTNTVILTANNITCQFGGLVAVNNVSLKIAQGEFHCIIGPNGAGKTTFFNAITGTINPTRGEIIFNGRSVTRDSPRKLARNGLIRTYQITRIFPSLTVSDHLNLATWSLRARSGNLESTSLSNKLLLEMLDLSKHVRSLASDLPHGDKRRLEIAMCVALQPSVLLLDEPTQGMGTVETRRTVDFLQEIRTLNPALSVVMIEHDMQLVFKIAERITVLNEGKLIVSGPPNQVAHNEDVRRAYLGDKFNVTVR